MPYSTFTLKDVEDSFGLTVEEVPDYFASAAEVAPGQYLQHALGVYLPLASSINTEKARSELIIAPILVEVREQTQRRVSFFSGVEFNVAPEKGLSGVCDFIMTRSQQQLFIRAPAVTIVEAKNENFKAGFGQCIASMVAAQMFNEQEGKPINVISGSVTTGSGWRFLQLKGKQVILDQREYHIESLPKIIGILLSMLKN